MFKTAADSVGVVHVCAEILYGSLMTVGLVPAPAAAADVDDDESVMVDVLRQHPGFTADSIGYNAETGQSVCLFS